MAWYTQRGKLCIVVARVQESDPFTPFYSSRLFYYIHIKIKKQSNGPLWGPIRGIKWKFCFNWWHPVKCNNLWMEGLKVILYALVEPLRYVCYISYGTIMKLSRLVQSDSCICVCHCLYPQSLLTFCMHYYHILLQNHPSQRLQGWRFALNGRDRFSEREGNHREHRRAVMGVYPALGCRGRRLLASTVGDFAMPLQPIGSIVLRCVEGVRMPLKGEQGHCSERSAGDTETLL